MADIVALLADLDTDVSSLPNFQSIGEATEVMSAFLTCLGSWHIWCVLSVRGAEVLLTWLKSGIHPDRLNPVQQFVFKNACEQVESVLIELKDGNLRFGATSSVSRVGNLRLDPSETAWDDSKRTDSIEAENDYTKCALPIVTFYRVQAIPRRLNFSVGEYVRVTLQTHDREKERSRGVGSSAPAGQLEVDDSETDFPPLQKNIDVSESQVRYHGSETKTAKSSGYCIGRIVALCEAPFSIAVKVVGPSYGMDSAPELLLRCLHHQPRAFWEISAVPANVITHMRNVEAISTFQEGFGNGCSVGPELLPYLVPCPNETLHSEEFPFGHALSADTLGLGTLNSRQRLAVESMLSNRVSLVHGPGGTGSKFESHRRLFCNAMFI